ncbi:MAG: type II toxin-antitoxin system RelE/ParE family toxin [Acidobacteriota bacterium]|nr:type II toxin-antitoxin system RelE/ParE family toxin [Acidobacteriota bacterium]
MTFRYVITDDAYTDLEDMEDYVRSYADDAFVESLEDEFFEAFDKLTREALQHPVYQFEPPVRLLREYRSVNVYHYKIFYYLRGEDVVIYRICHLVSDFTRRGW